MIVAAFALFVSAAFSSIADTDFTLMLGSGEISRDASSSETTWKLDGTTLTRDGKSSGHVGRQDDTHKTTTVRPEDLKKLAELLADIDAAAKKVKGKARPREGRFTSVSYAHGKQTLELFFPYWLSDEVHRPKDEKKEKLEAMEKIDQLRRKLFDIES